MHNPRASGAKRRARVYYFRTANYTRVSILFMSWTVFDVMRMREYKLRRSDDDDDDDKLYLKITR
jgi:hypothetical protein